MSQHLTPSSTLLRRLRSVAGCILFIAFLGAFLAVPVKTVQAQLVTFDVAGATANQSSLTPSTASGVSATDLGRSGGITTESLWDGEDHAFVAGQWSDNGSRDGNKYFSFTVSPANAGEALDLSQLQFGLSREYSNSADGSGQIWIGPRKADVTYVIGGSEQTLESGLDLTNSGDSNGEFHQSSFTVDLSSIPNATGTVEIRFYLYDRPTDAEAASNPNFHVDATSNSAEAIGLLANAPPDSDVENRDVWRETSSDVILSGSVVQANAAPTFTAGSSASLTVDEDAAATSLSSQLETDDPDSGQTLEWTVSAAPSNGTLSGFPTTESSGSGVQPSGLTYEPDTDFNGADAFDVQVSDGSATDVITINVTVNAVNDAPTISSISDQTIEEDGTLSSLSFTVDDTETSDLSTLTLSGSSGNTTLVPNSNISFTGPDASGNASITVQPAANESGTATITVTVDDGSSSNNTASDSFVLTVNAVADLTITDGSASELDFTADVSPGTNNNPVGIFELSAGQSGATLDGVTVTNNSPGVSGITNARLYLSADQNLVPVEDQQEASFDVTDNSAEAEFDFTGIGSMIPTGGYYAILAIDVASGASASGIQFSLDQTSDLTVTGGEIATVNGNPQSTFSALELSNGTTALPVELARFDATTSEGEAVSLQWQTASETGNAGFEVQRRIASAPGVRKIGSVVKPSRTTGMTSGPRDGSTPSVGEKAESWQTVGSVDGAGTTTDAQSYRFTDEDLPYDADSLTYRLKQVDTDGSAGYSEPITVARSAVEQVQLLGTYPNPARQRATVRFAIPDETATSGATLRLYDTLGREVRTVQAPTEAGRHTVQLETARLPSGVYFLRLQAGTTVKTQRLTVVR